MPCREIHGTMPGLSGDFAAVDLKFDPGAVMILGGRFNDFLEFHIQPADAFDRLGRDLRFDFINARIK